MNRYENFSQLDIRVDKVLQLHYLRVVPMVEVFNLTNANTVLSRIARQNADNANNVWTVLSGRVIRFAPLFIRNQPLEVATGRSGPQRRAPSPHFQQSNSLTRFDPGAPQLVAALPLGLHGNTGAYAAQLRGLALAWPHGEAAFQRRGFEGPYTKPLQPMDDLAGEPCVGSDPRPTKW